MLFLIVCSLADKNEKNLKEKNMYKISQEIIGKEAYFDVYNKLKDSLNSWSLNNLGYYQYCGKSKNCFIDSLLCFNKEGSRFITGKLMQQLLKEGVADDIDFMLGEKINNQWYFFSGANIFIPREMVKDQPINKPLSYQQLHQIALKEVCGGYLNKDGEINEAWFISQFEGAGWGDFYHQDSLSDWFLKGRRFKTEKEYYEAAHLDKVRNNWYGIKKDSIKQLQNKNGVLP